MDTKTINAPVENCSECPFRGCHDYEWVCKHPLLPEEKDGTIYYTMITPRFCPLRNNFTILQVYLTRDFETEDSVTNSDSIK